MSGKTGRFQSMIYALALLGGGGAVAYTYLEELILPYVPLIIAIIGGLVAGLLVRYIFIRLFNKKLLSSYRYTK